MVKKGGTTVGRTFKPATNVLEARQIRDIVEQQRRVRAPVVHGSLDRGEHTALVEGHCQRSATTYHAAEALLACGVPELEADLEAADVDLLGDEERAGRRRRVLRVELASGVSVQEAGLADACVG